MQVRATHGAHQGTWYYEVRVTHLGATGHARLGWATRKAELQAPVRAALFFVSRKLLLIVDLPPTPNQAAAAVPKAELQARCKSLLGQTLLSRKDTCVVTFFCRGCSPQSATCTTPSSVIRSPKQTLDLQLQCFLGSRPDVIHSVLQVGYDQHGYGYRDLQGSKVLPQEIHLNIASCIPIHPAPPQSRNAIALKPLEPHSVPFCRMYSESAF